jgi:aspartate beta-hydroxylase
VVFYDNGVRFDGPPALYPETAALLDEVHARERLPGLASLLRLHPGSRVTPHCGHTNSRLRVHLGIRVPEGAGMRVRDEVVAWEEGRVLVFDDSFEHEVWNQGTAARVILLLDVLNPAVPPSAMAQDDARVTSFEDTVKGFMREHHLKRVVRTDDADGLRPVFDEVMARTVRRYFRHGNIESVELQGNA